MVPGGTGRPSGRIPSVSFEMGKRGFAAGAGKLFDEPVAETLEEAEEFLEDCMAVVVDSLKEVCDYLEESGMDISGLSLDEIRELEEVFELEDGTYLIVEA